MGANENDKCKYKAVCIDFSAQLKDYEDKYDVLCILEHACLLWVAVGGTVCTTFAPEEHTAHLTVSGVSPEIVALMEMTSEQCPDVSYVSESE